MFLSFRKEENNNKVIIRKGGAGRGEEGRKDALLLCNSVVKRKDGSEQNKYRS